MKRAAVTILLVASCWLVASPAAGQHATLGTINFPNSGSPAAQPYFIEGVKFLHSFEWEDAADRFRKAQQADPGFALAYWGEALSYTGGHHYPMGQDMSAARKALVKLAATRAERLAKAPTERERGYLNAVEVLYGEGDGQERAQQYARAMGTLSERFPDDDEAATLHALALMRTARRGQESARVDMQAGAICASCLSPERQPSRRRSLHRSRLRRPVPRHRRARGRGRLCVPRARRAARAPHAVAHLRAARSMGQTVGSERAIVRRLCQAIRAEAAPRD